MLFTPWFIPLLSDPFRSFTPKLMWVFSPLVFSTTHISWFPVKSLSEWVRLFYTLMKFDRRGCTTKFGTVFCFKWYCTLAIPYPHQRHQYFDVWQRCARERAIYILSKCWLSSEFLLQKNDCWLNCNCTFWIVGVRKFKTSDQRITFQFRCKKYPGKRVWSEWAFLLTIF